MEHIQIGAVINKYKAVLLECKQLEKDITGDKWTLGDLKGLSTEDFWTWEESDRLAYDRDAYLGLKNCANFDKEIWFELGKDMQRKQRSVFQNHIKYICNEIMKTFHAVVLRYAKHVQDMHELVKHLPPPSMKGGDYKSANW